MEQRRDGNGGEKGQESRGQGEAGTLKPPIGSMIFGAALIVAGTLLGVGRFGWLPIDNPADLWPLVLIGIGANKLWQTWGTAATGNGAWLVLAGLWLLMVQLRLFGLSLRNSWPLMLIFAGLVVVWRSFVPGDSNPRGEEVPNGR